MGLSLLLECSGLHLIAIVVFRAWARRKTNHNNNRSVVGGGVVVCLLGRVQATGQGLDMGVVAQWFGTLAWSAQGCGFKPCCV